MTSSLFLALMAAPRRICASSKVSAIGDSRSVQNPLEREASACLTWSVEHVAMSTRSMSRSSRRSLYWRNMRHSGKSAAILSRRSFRRSHAATTRNMAGCALNTA